MDKGNQLEMQRRYLNHHLSNKNGRKDVVGDTQEYPFLQKGEKPAVEIQTGKGSTANPRKSP